MNGCFPCCCSKTNTRTQHLPKRNNTKNPHIDYNLLNDNIDKIATKLVQNYTESPLFRKSIMLNAAERALLEMTTRHMIAICSSMILDHVVPPIESSMVCPNQLQ